MKKLIILFFSTLVLLSSTAYADTIIIWGPTQYQACMDNCLMENYYTTYLYSQCAYYCTHTPDVIVVGVPRVGWYPRHRHENPRHDAPRHENPRNNNHNHEHR